MSIIERIKEVCMECVLLAVIIVLAIFGLTAMMFTAGHTVLGGVIFIGAVFALLCTDVSSEDHKDEA